MATGRNLRALWQVLIVQVDGRTVDVNRTILKAHGTVLEERINACAAELPHRL